MTAQPDHAGLVSWRRSRSTGTQVGVYNNAEAGLDDDGGENPWSTVCEPHGGLVSHPTKTLALAHAPHPETWCATCQEDAR